MRRVIFWAGWTILFVLPVIFTVQIFVIQDLPKVQAWKWLVPAAAVVMIFFARNRDDVLKHHLG